MSWYALHQIIELIAIIFAVHVMSKSATLRNTIIRMTKVDRLDLIYINFYGGVILVTTFVQLICNSCTGFASENIEYGARIADGIRHVLVPTALVFIADRPRKLSKWFFVTICVSLVLSTLATPMHGGIYYTRDFPWMYGIAGIYSLLCLVHLQIGLNHARSNGGVDGPKLIRAVQISLWSVIAYTIACGIAEVTMPLLQIPFHLIAVGSIMPIVSYMREGD